MEITPDLRRAIASQAREELKRRGALYQPYDKQKYFHALGATKRERCLSAGNQQGKTQAGAAEATFHLTGIYPDWWEGRRWDRPVVGWCGGVTAETVRDGPQSKLLGTIGDWGSGLIPRGSIVNVAANSHAGQGAVDFFTVKHASGGISTCKFKHYKQDREKWQGPPVDFVWPDEEPPEEIYFEALSRTNATGGMLFMTFTPLKGMSKVVYRFWKEESSDRELVCMTLADAQHIPEERRQQIIDSYPEHERKARTEGIPSVGSGNVYPVDERDLKVAPFEIPSHWRRVYGLDFGWHNTAAVFMAHDPDKDIVYITASYKQGQKTPESHAVILRNMGASWMPGVCDPAGQIAKQDDGENLINLFRRSGLSLSKADNSVESGIQQVLERMYSGRLKVFADCQDWFGELALYCRDEQGRIKKENDHLMDATRYALVSGLGVATVRRLQSGSSFIMPKVGIV